VKKIIVAAVMVTMMAAVAYAKNYEVKKKAGQNDVTVTIDRNPPVVGDNNVTIEIRDPSGKTVADAKVRVDYSMPAMPGMPAMNYKSEAVPQGGVYKTKMNLSMGGSWNVVVKISRGGSSSTVKFSIDAR
jgi:hypothetical protein